MAFILRRLHALWSFSSSRQSHHDNSNKQCEVDSHEIAHSSFDLTAKTNEFGSPPARGSSRRFLFWRRKKHMPLPQRDRDGQLGQTTLASVSANDLLATEKAFSSDISVQQPHELSVEETPNLHQTNADFASSSTSPQVSDTSCHLVPTSRLANFKVELEEKLKNRSRRQSPSLLAPHRAHKNSNDTDEALTSTEDDMAISSDLRSSQEDMADSPSPSPTYAPRQSQGRRVYPPLSNIRSEPMESSRDIHVHPPEEDPALRRTPDSGMGVSMSSLVVSLADESTTVSPIIDFGIHPTTHTVLDNSVAKQRIAAARPLASRRRRTPQQTSSLANVPLVKAELVSTTSASDIEEKPKVEISCTLQPTITEETCNELQQTCTVESSSRPEPLPIDTISPSANPQTSSNNELSSGTTEVSSSPSIAEIKKLFTSKVSVQPPPPVPGSKPSVTPRPRTLPSTFTRPVSTLPTTSTGVAPFISTSNSSTRLSLSPTVALESSAPFSTSQLPAISKKPAFSPILKEKSAVSAQSSAPPCGSASVQNLSAKSPTVPLAPPSSMTTSMKRGQVHFPAARRGSTEMLDKDPKTTVETSPQEQRRSSSTRVQDLVKNFQNRQ